MAADYHDGIPDDFVETATIVITKGFRPDSEGAVVYVAQSAGLSLMDAIGMVAFTQSVLPELYASNETEGE